MTKSITTWNRLEPRSQAENPGPGPALEARIYDPAWLLGRQWQLGELTGEDGGSPAITRIRSATSPLTRFRPAEGLGPAVRIAADELLEPLAETESEPDDWRYSAEMGAHFLELLAAAGLSQLHRPFRLKFAFEPTHVGADAEGRALRLIRRRSLDGVRLRDAVISAGDASAQPIAVPPSPNVPASQAARLLEVLRRWIGWHPPRRVRSSWIAERMEYQFVVAARSPGGPGEVALGTSEYEGGRLDWPDFDAIEARSLAAGRDGPVSRAAASFLPTPITYPGMPASRWWEFEDGRVWFGGIETEAGDLARMILVEFATIYGNDWFLVPFDADAGSLVRFEAIVVVDTFGRQTLLSPTEISRPSSGPGSWRMFRTAGLPADTVFVPPVVAGSLQGTSVEEVAFVRDETANMAWAIERKITNMAGETVDRFERWRAGRAAGPGRQPSDRMSYQVMTDVPDHWIPLVPRSIGTRAIRLDRGAVVNAAGNEVRPLSRILEPHRSLSLFEEEVPREGIRVERSWQVARTPTGASVMWLGRRKRPGRGEASSGLAFDKLTPPDRGS